MERLIQRYSGQGKLVFPNNGEAVVNYLIEEFQNSVPDGFGGQVSTTKDRRGRVSHTEGHPNWHPIVSLHPGPFTLVMEDGHKLKAILLNELGDIQCSGDFF